MLRYTQSERRNLSALDSMRIRTATGSQVPFATVAKATLGRGFSAIKRIDGRRVVNVTADIDRTNYHGKRDTCGVRRGPSTGNYAGPPKGELQP